MSSNQEAREASSPAGATSQPLFRLFLDESGDHTLSNLVDIGKRYLGVVSVAFAMEHYRQFCAELTAFKLKHIPYDPDEAPVVLHRKEIKDRSGPFSFLHDEEKRAAFDDDLIALVAGAEFTTITVVIDKPSHFPKTYRERKHPYHYCLEVLLERYRGFLQGGNARYLVRGLRPISGDIIAESRGGREDLDLKRVYAHFYNNGTRYLSSRQLQSYLTNGQLKIKKKTANIAGLQLADLLAHPMTRRVLLEKGHVSDLGSPFAERVGQAVKGKVNSYGLVLLD